MIGIIMMYMKVYCIIPFTRVTDSNELNKRLFIHNLIPKSRRQKSHF